MLHQIVLFEVHYQVEAKKSTESDFKIISTGSQLNHELLNVIDAQTYDVRVKAINSFGVSSSFVSASRTNNWCYRYTI